MSSFAARRKKKKLGLTLMSFGPSSEEADLAATLAAHGELNVNTDRQNIKEVIKEHSVSNVTTDDIIKETEKEGPYNIQEDLIFLHKLGQGTAGTVSLYLYVPTLKLVAVKEMDISSEQHRIMYEHELHAVHNNIRPLDIAAGIERTRKMLSSSNVLHHVINNDHKMHSNNLFRKSSQKISNNNNNNNNNEDTGSKNKKMPHRSRKNSISRNSRAGKRLRTLVSFHLQPSRYIVSFYGAYVKSEQLLAALVMEFMDGGSLNRIVENGGIQSENVLRHIAFSSLKGLATMHSKQTLHRDIKPDNILINTNGDVKVADFGLASHVDKKDDSLKSFEGTLAYMSPERMKGDPYSYASDIWSVGMSILALALGCSPRFFLKENPLSDDNTDDKNNDDSGGGDNNNSLSRVRSGSNFFDLMSAISNPLNRSLLTKLKNGTVVRRDGIDYQYDSNNNDDTSNGFSQNMVDFVFQTLNLDPLKRGTAVELLNHPFLKNESNRDEKLIEILKNDWNQYVNPITVETSLEILENILDNIKVHCGACAIFSENAINKLAKELRLTEDEVYNEFITAGMRIESK